MNKILEPHLRFAFADGPRLKQRDIMVFHTCHDLDARFWVIFCKIPKDWVGDLVVLLLRRSSSVNTSCINNQGWGFGRESRG